MPISSLYSSILIVVRWADLVSGFFGTYNGTLRQSGSGDSSVLIGIFCTNLAFQDRTPSPLPSPVLVFSCRLEASARGRWHRAGLLPPSSGVPLSIPQKLLKHPRLHPLRTDASILWRPSSTSTPQKLNSIHNYIHSRIDATFLWRPSSTSNTKNRLQKKSPAQT